MPCRVAFWADTVDVRGNKSATVVVSYSHQPSMLSPITSTAPCPRTRVDAVHLWDANNNIQPREGNSQEMSTQRTVRETTYDLLRSLGLTTIFGNPGSTEETFLKNFPDDFSYVLGLQEASVMAMADGFAQSTGKPALVNVHTGAGIGNAMGSLIAVGI